MADNFLPIGNGSAFVGGPFISVPTAPIKAFVHEVGAVQHPTSQEIFEKVFRHQVETERQIEAALTYVGNLGLVANLPEDVLSEIGVNNAMRNEEATSVGGEEAAEILNMGSAADVGEEKEKETVSPKRASSTQPPRGLTRAIPTSSTPLQHIHLPQITLLEENLLATRAALAHLYDVHGEHRTPMVTNTVLMKRASERLTEARRIAMARGLVRRMNDDVDVKGNAQIVGEVNKVDVGRIEAEREEILKLMEKVRKRHEDFLNS